MKINAPSLPLSEKIDEFDFWITPSLGEIRDSRRYGQALASICGLIELIGEATNSFEKYDDFSSDVIAAAILSKTYGWTQSDTLRIINALTTFLFLVTGKTDNNSKCQFPLFLRDVARVDNFPSVSNAKGKKALSTVPIPREIKGERLSKLVADLSFVPDKQHEILNQYIAFIVSGDHYLRSLWTIGRTYFQMKAVGFEHDFLQPLIIFQIRGSVSASGGHEPEEFLRDRMLEWGLLAGSDFNSADAIIKELEKTNVEDAVTEITVAVEETDDVESLTEKIEETVKKKTRAFDFVLPYKVPGWEQRIFIQCQFYAGDSGSVSHKNVDQTRTSRESVKEKRSSPIFIEYIDGAGYFSSLWGDLKKIIAMDDTTDFFQVRTAALKLRGHLQSLGFLTPMEVIHAWALNGGVHGRIKAHLVSEGYSEKEIDRVVAGPFFSVVGDRLSFDEKAIEISRRYLLLDFIANQGQPFKDLTRLSGVLLVPAFGKFHGVRMDDIGQKIIPHGGQFEEIWKDSASLLSDIQFLADHGWIIQR